MQQDKQPISFLQPKIMVNAPYLFFDRDKTMNLAILAIAKGEMVPLKTHIPKYCIR